MVFTHMRGAVIPTSVHNGFPRASILRSVAYSSTLRSQIRIIFGELKDLKIYTYECEAFFYRAFVGVFLCDFYQLWKLVLLYP